MKTKLMLVAALVVAASMMSFGAFAQTPAKDIKVDVVGKVTVKMEKKDGKDVSVASILVAEAKAMDKADEKVATELKGKSLVVVGPKVADVEKLKDKEVIATGTLKDGDKSLDVMTVAAKPMPAPAPVKPAAPAAPKK